MKAGKQRQLRVGEEIRHILAGLFLRAEFRDRQLAAAQITVTEVRMSADLRHALVFFAQLGRADAAALLPALERAGPFLRGVVAHQLRLRYAPMLRFVPDESQEHAALIGALLKRPDVARDLE